MNQTKEGLLEFAAKELAGELARMHGTIHLLCQELQKTELDMVQGALVTAALVELRRSQSKFMATFGDEIGGANPGAN